MYRKLYRTVDGRTRYYLLSCQPNLFGDFIVSRVYGSALNKKPTGEKIELFASEEEARSYYEAVLRKNKLSPFVKTKSPFF
jgi:hypothetical protein